MFAPTQPEKMEAWAVYRKRGLQKHLLAVFGLPSMLYTAFLTALTGLVLPGGKAAFATGRWDIFVRVFLLWSAVSIPFRIIAWFKNEREYRDFERTKNA
jgi:hypothetical protein